MEGAPSNGYSKGWFPKVWEIWREIEFSSSKKDIYINYSGKFSNPETPKEIAELFEKEIIYKVVKIRALKVNQDVIDFTKKIIEKLNNHLSDWAVYI